MKYYYAILVINSIALGIGAFLLIATISNRDDGGFTDKDRVKLIETKRRMAEQSTDIDSLRKEYFGMVMLYEESDKAFEEAEHLIRNLSKYIIFFAIFNLFIALIFWFFRKFGRKTNRERT